MGDISLSMSTLLQFGTYLLQRADTSFFLHGCVSDSYLLIVIDSFSHRAMFLAL